ncbi:SMP-30/gluconolactonase/LRE family protein [Moritella marina]|uniref:SMP-30/gluconolactonase/LRE family protein n=1 Tax=Moritella marina TaxID=90736 RepID=UPI003703CAC3
MPQVNVFVNMRCSLGEGVYLDLDTNYLYWLDINNSMLFRKKIKNEQNDVESFKVGSMPSVILSVKGDVVIFSERRGIYKFNLITKFCTLLGSSLSSDITCKMRANDGVKLRSGKYIFGTMSLTAINNKGSLYSYDGMDISSSEPHITIPNTFIELDSDVLISDSAENKIYSYPKSSLLDYKTRQLWWDSNCSNVTPDGGCLSDDGYIYIAMWGAACIYKFNQSGHLLNKIQIPALQPTNCIISNNKLYVTSALDGMSEEQIKQYPLSGSVFEILLEKK